MVEIGSFEAKTKFSGILRRVENGEEFYITKHGKRVAFITSPDYDLKKRAREAYSTLRELQKKTPIGSLAEILEWKNEGRR